MEWTPEKIAKLSKQELERLRDNAISRNQTVVELCTGELERRRPVRVKASNTTDHDDEFVSGFHFVCANEQGVTRNHDGTAWTGTWVVAEVHAERAAKYGAYVALHESKAMPSYLQGIIKDFRRSPRERSYTEGQEVQTETGIEFLFEITDKPYAWIGDGSGEKGYAWRLLTEATDSLI